MGPSQDKPKHEQTYPLDLNASQAVSLPVTYGIPADMPPGIYHIDYMLLDERKRPMTAPVESGDAWFEVMPQSPPPPPALKAPQSLVVVPAGFSVLPSYEHRGDRIKIDLAITRTSGPTGNYSLFARIAGQEAQVRYAQDRGSASVEVPAGPAGNRISYALYHAGGRSLARGSIPVVPPQKSGISVDRPWYLPGEKVRVSVTGMGAGEISVSGLGSVHRDHSRKDRVFELSVPGALPSGTYPLSWEFQTTAGARHEGEISVAIQGARVVCKDVSIIPQSPHSSASITASFRFSSNQTQQAVLNVQPVSPDGKVLPGRETAVSLIAGNNDIDLSVPFTPDRAGIWSFRYTLSARLPEGSGFSSDPVMLLSGRVHHDAGNAAILAIHTDKPMYYEASGRWHSLP